MKFKPGDKVWIDNGPSRNPRCLPAGTYAATLVEIEGSFPTTNGSLAVFWQVELEDASLPHHQRVMAPEGIMRPRDDPQPAQEPKREATGQWDSCVWKPAREEVLI